MSDKTPRNNASNNRQRNPVRPSITLELVRALAPGHAGAEKLAAAFGLDPVDYDGIRDTTRDNLIQVRRNAAGRTQQDRNDHAHAAPRRQLCQLRPRCSAVLSEPAAAVGWNHPYS